MEKSEKQRRRKLAIEKLATLFGKDPSTLDSDTDDSDSDTDDELVLRKRILTVTNNSSVATMLAEILDEAYWNELVMEDNIMGSYDDIVLPCPGFNSGVTETNEMLHEV